MIATIVGFTLRFFEVVGHLILSFPLSFATVFIFPIIWFYVLEKGFKVSQKNIFLTIGFGVLYPVLNLFLLYLAFFFGFGAGVYSIFIIPVFLLVLYFLVFHKFYLLETKNSAIMSIVFVLIVAIVYTFLFVIDFIGIMLQMR